MSSPSITLQLDGQPQRVLFDQRHPWFVVHDLCRILHLQPADCDALAPADRSLLPNPQALGPDCLDVVNISGLYDLLHRASRRFPLTDPRRRLVARLNRRLTYHYLPLLLEALRRAHDDIHARSLTIDALQEDYA